ncbi:hypothetical protein GH714_020093 [Hevea brasiliensis]|uniref:Uncharacterized protein n=1 Tax=Hevea brasiliensis TaxID=3981 RepID=A0A6A6K790_HEVBR|nr:hypothetical protein GH714_020093 [Hevea brasiliensis]
MDRNLRNAGPSPSERTNIEIEEEENKNTKLRSWRSLHVFYPDPNSVVDFTLSCNVKPEIMFSYKILERNFDGDINKAELYGSQVILQQEHVIPVRYFAKKSEPPALKGDENKTHYETRTKDIPDARTYLLTLKEIRIKRGLTDELGAEAMMMDALERVEKEIKKPLMRSDKKGMALLMTEFDKINKKLGIRKEDLPKYEEELELKIAKAQLEELKKDALEAMEAQKKREEFKDEATVDVKSLDIRNFL